MKIVPWRGALRRVAKAYGFIDPLEVFTRVRAFSKEAEISYPFELLRSGAVFHARGLINTQAIQHNLDWRWPFWIARQFDPADDGFLPRAFSITHVNLTHRNWTAVGLPDLDEYPIVDPAGMLTPYYDGWSIECAVLHDNGELFHPAEKTGAEQMLLLENGVALRTTVRGKHALIESSADVVERDGNAVLRLNIDAVADIPGSLIVAVRPYNPEGISFIEKLQASGDRSIVVNGEKELRFSAAPGAFYFSDYEGGDLYKLLEEKGKASRGIECEVGMASGCGVFPLTERTKRSVGIELDLPNRGGKSKPWSEALKNTAQIRIPNERLAFLFDAAVHTLILHSPGDVYPGPYTYRRFWFRDAAFILKALLAAHLPDRVERTLQGFPARQRKNGYFHSQDGEWDSNGEALWILEEFFAATGKTLPAAWLGMIESGGNWILHKRLPESSKAAHGGLLPAGFSAEHFGPSDYYYWDDFWGVAGLRAAAALAKRSGDRFTRGADQFLRSIERNIERTPPFKKSGAVPVSPYRRMDSAAVGSLVAGYPLKLWPQRDARMLATAEYLEKNSFYDGAFFQEMIHSGVNAYLSLHVAQILLRAGDFRFFDILETVARYATVTGQWPEAIHPRTKGGCMGDGQHVWAAAEWVQILRNMFADEEGTTLVLLRGIPEKWLAAGAELRFGPTCTRFGDLTVNLYVTAEQISITWTGKWHTPPASIEVHLLGQKIPVPPHESALTIDRKAR